MEFAKEFLEKATAAKTAEELLETAKAENIEMNAEEAEKMYAELHKSGELSDDELDNVAGGYTENQVKSFLHINSYLVGVPADSEYHYEKGTIVTVRKGSETIQAKILEKQPVSQNNHYEPGYWFEPFPSCGPNDLFYGAQSDIVG